MEQRKKQVYFQLWHGNIALKKIEFDVPEKLGKYYVKSAINDNKIIDYMISNSMWCTEILYKGAFKYKKTIFEYGTPRNDILINKDNNVINKVRKYLNISNDCKVLLYAPTFRNKYNGQYNIDFEQLISTLEKKYNTKWVVLLRLHPNVRNKAKEYGIEYKNNVIDACYYDDMQELIALSDIIITDYSSVMFDGMIGNIPVLLYATDIDAYNEERGTYFKLNELPFKVSINNDELNNIIKENSFDDLKKSYDSFKKKIGLIENGQASKKVGELIYEIIKK